MSCSERLRSVAVTQMGYKQRERAGCRFQIARDHTHRLSRGKRKKENRQPKGVQLATP